MGPDLTAMGEDSCSGGRGFKSQHRMLHGLFHIDLLQKIMANLKKQCDEVQMH